MRIEIVQESPPEIAEYAGVPIYRDFPDETQLLLYKEIRPIAREERSTSG